MFLLRYGESLKPQLGDIPPWLPLGWAQVESKWRLSLVDRSAFTDGEMSFFQLSPDERKQLGVDDSQLLSDADYSIGKGLDLIRLYAEKVRAFGLPEGSDLFWWAVKLVHGIGELGARLMFEDMRSHGVEPTTPLEVSTYFLPMSANDKRVAQAIKSASGKIHYPSKWAANATRVYTEGIALAKTSGLLEAVKEHPRLALSAGILLLGGLVALILLTNRKAA